MEDRIHLCIVTADAAVLDRYVSYINIPTPFGSVGVMQLHAPMLCAVEKGTVRYTAEGKNFLVRVSDGVANVSDNEVTLLVSAAEEITE